VSKTAQKINKNVMGISYFTQTPRNWLSRPRQRRWSLRPTT